MLVIGNLYKDVNYYPVWTNSKNKKDVLVILEISYYEGLNSEDYHLTFIKDYLSSSEEFAPKDLAAVDIIMTDAVLTFAFHLIQGKVHPY
jgi:hypothetical protein